MVKYSVSSLRAIAIIFLIYAAMTFAVSTRAVGEDLVAPIEGFKQAIRNAVLDSTSPMEFELFKKIEQGMGTSKTSDHKETYRAFAKWLVGDIELENDAGARLVTCMYVFCGTSEDVHCPDKLNVHREQIASGEDPIILVLLRMAESSTAPSATIAAVVEVKGKQQQGLYAVRKNFEYRANGWVLLTSRMETIE
jgi:hypothetical protein